MSKYVIDSETLTDIADAIRAKTGDSASMTPLEMPDEIASISGGGGAGYYNIASGDIYALFDQYATENGMTKIDVTIPTDATSNTTIQHNLGYVPTEALLYPKNAVDSGSAYQVGCVTNSQFGKDNLANRTFQITSRNSTTQIQPYVWYPSRKTLLSLLASFNCTGYNFTQANSVTDTTIAIRGGTQAQTKLLAGEYVLALK